MNKTEALTVPVVRRFLCSFHHGFVKKFPSSGRGFGVGVPLQESAGISCILVFLMRTEMHPGDSVTLHTLLSPPMKTVIINWKLESFRFFQRCREYWLSNSVRLKDIGYPESDEEWCLKTIPCTGKDDNPYVGIFVVLTNVIDPVPCRNRSLVSEIRMKRLYRVDLCGFRYFALSSPPPLGVPLLLQRIHNHWTLELFFTPLNCLR